MVCARPLTRRSSPADRSRGCAGNGNPILTGSVERQGKWPRWRAGENVAIVAGGGGSVALSPNRLI